MIDDSLYLVTAELAKLTGSGVAGRRLLLLLLLLCCCGGLVAVRARARRCTGGVSTSPRTSTIHHQQAITIRRSTTTAQLAVGSQTPECEEVESNQQEVSLRDEEGDASKHE